MNVLEKQMSYLKLHLKMNLKKPADFCGTPDISCFITKFKIEIMYISLATFS